MGPSSPIVDLPHVLITGATGYLGRALVPALLERGHAIRALVRAAKAGSLDKRVETMVGDPLSADSIEPALEGIDVVVHLVGVPKPSPAKAKQFREIDLVSIRALTSAISRRRERPHVVYLSVAQPAPVMKAYQEVRAEGEMLVAQLKTNATFLRPWYVFGPGHRWPIVLLPIYALLRLLPGTRGTARRLGFVTLTQMTAAIVCAVENEPEGIRIMDVEEIKERAA